MNTETIINLSCKAGLNPPLPLNPDYRIYANEIGARVIEVWHNTGFYEIPMEQRRLIATKEHNKHYLEFQKVYEPLYQKAIEKHGYINVMVEYRNKEAQWKNVDSDLDFDWVKDKRNHLKLRPHTNLKRVLNWLKSL